jgi:holliday junction DNA helicase RuvA
MIGWLSGILRRISSDRATIDVGGVGYEVSVPSAVLGRLGGVGSKVELFIHTHVREDAIQLYGFPTLPDRDLFEHLIGVTGIGAKTALAILSSIPGDALIQAIQRKDTGLLQRTPGIGRKTAERMVMELSDKLRGFELGVAPSLVSRVAPGTPEEELVSALLNLGYRRGEAEAALARIDLTKSASFDTMLRETLKVLAR